METFGHNLKQAIASRGLTPEQVAQVTGLGLQRVRALQEDDFTDLPDDGTVEKSLRALARLLDVDADQVIADYRRERERRPVPAPPPPHPEEEPAVERPRGRLASPIVPAAIILAVAAVTLVIWMRSPSETPGPNPIETAAPTLPPAREPATIPLPAAEPDMPEAIADATPGPPVDRVEPEEPVEQKQPAAQDEPPVVPAETAPAPPPVEPEPPGLSIPAHGVGTAVVNHELVGRTDRFTVGSQAWYWTFLQDGTPGQRVEHVWLHEGAVVARVPMTIGGPRWRTKSYKTLKPGSEGAWVVEARDESGRVLARDEFRCVADTRP